MAHWVFSTDPGTYSADDLRRDARTVWDGVAGAPAQKFLREGVRRGDHALIYHTAPERRLVALAKVASDPYPDPADPAGKRVAVDLEWSAALPRPVDLAALKAHPVLKQLKFVRQPRLSISPLSPAEVAALREVTGWRS